jgi:adenylate cyclase
MRESQIRATLRRIQDIVRDATGSALTGKAREQLVSVLNRFAGISPAAFADDSFSQRDVTILFADLRGFASMTASCPAAVVIGALNRCFVKMSEIIFQHHGGIDKFMGDAIMVIFARNWAARGEEVRHAMACAVSMQIAMQELNATREPGVPELYMGIGVNTGSVMAGLVGSELYCAYTVIGEEVNLASRIEAFSLRGQVLISQATYELCQEFVTAGPPMDVYVKGRTDLVRIREVLEIPSTRQAVPRRELRRSPRVRVELPFTYQLMLGEIVRPQESNGLINDIGYHGLRCVLEHPIALHSEIKLAFDLPMPAHRASEIYAKVVKVSETGGRYLASMEFSSIRPEIESKIQLFVQMLVQGANTP